MVRPSVSGVGSNSTQPVPGKYASTQACASEVRIERKSSTAVPPVNPTATRAGMPTARSITAIAEENCSQYPARPTVRNSTRASSPPGGAVCRLYRNGLSRPVKKSCTAMARSKLLVRPAVT